MEGERELGVGIERGEGSWEGGLRGGRGRGTRGGEHWE